MDTKSYTHGYTFRSEYWSIYYDSESALVRGAAVVLAESGPGTKALQISLRDTRRLFPGGDVKG